MPIKQDKINDYLAWLVGMEKAGEIRVISFFKLLCRNYNMGFDPFIIVSNLLNNSECDRPYEANNQEIYLAMHAFSQFHEKGDDFRWRWNASQMGEHYAEYSEECGVKHVITPFAYHSVLDSEFFPEQ